MYTHALLCDSCFKQLVTLKKGGPWSGTGSEQCDTPQSLLVVDVYGAVVLLKSRIAAFETNDSIKDPIKETCS